MGPTVATARSVARYSFGHSYHVLVEGTLRAARYGRLAPVAL
ncbi:hypothetical protein OG762_04590 [Streptomyces sp. NBC_01136]|nr:hypothetical protein OG762_04590 [Streptomyces sp. NBC_01136]